MILAMEIISQVFAKMFNKFDTEKPDSFNQRTLPESSARSFTNRNRDNKQIGEDLITLSLFQQKEFSGYFLESMDMTCSQMHGITDIHVPKIVKEYSDNPELWRKFNASHSKFRVQWIKIHVSSGLN